MLLILSNTPWRRHKISAYEGGISTPLLARWSAGIPAANRGKLVREPAHVLDLLPTVLELAGATYPAQGALKPQGESILTMLKGNPGNASRTLFWEHEGNRAVRQGNWKLVALGPGHPWELYDLEKDRLESQDLATERPEILKALAAEYDQWAARPLLPENEPPHADPTPFLGELLLDGVNGQMHWPIGSNAATLTNRPAARPWTR